MMIMKTYLLTLFFEELDNVRDVRVLDLAVILAFDIVYFVGTMKKVKFQKYQYTGRRKNV